MRVKKLEELPRLVAWKSRGKWFEQNGTKVFHICSEGFGDRNADRPKLVLVHGYPTASFDFRRILPTLEKNFDVFVWDFVGYGFSSKVYRDVHGQIDTLQALFEHEFGASTEEKLKFHCLSHDLGDTLMQEMCARIVNKAESSSCNFEMQSIVALNGGMLPTMHRPTFIQKALLNRWVGPFIAKFVNIHIMKQSISKVFGPNTKPSDLEIEEFYELITCDGGDALISENILYMQDRQDNHDRYVDSLKEWVNKGYGPFMLIDGPADPVSGRHLAHALETEIPKAKIVLLADDIGHWPQLEDPENLLSHFLQFHTDQCQTFNQPPPLADIPE